MKKYTVVLVMTALLLTAALTAHAGQVELMWVVNSGGPERDEMWETVADMYMEQNPDVVIDLNFPTGNYYEAIRTWITGGVSPDVFRMGSDAHMLLDVAYDLSDFAATDAHASQIHPVILQHNDWLGSQIGVPFGVNLHTLAYNKELFDEYGVPYPTSDWTWDEAIDIAGRLTRTDADETYLYGMNISFFDQFATTTAGNFYTPDFRDTNITHPANIEAIQTYADIYSGRLGVSYPCENFIWATHMNLQSMFQGGELAMYNAANWAISPYRRDNPFDWDITTFPYTVVDGERYNSTFINAESWMVYEGSPNLEEALDFLAFLLSDEPMALVAEQEFVIPAQQAQVVDYLSRAPAPPANIMAFMEAMDHGYMRDWVHPVGRTVFLEVTRPNIMPVLLGDTSAAIAAEEIQRQVQVMLEDFWADFED